VMAIGALLSPEFFAARAESETTFRSQLENQPTLRPTLEAFNRIEKPRRKWLRSISPVSV